MVRISLVVVAVVLAWATPASGATFALRVADGFCDRGGCERYQMAEYLAAPSEANRITVRGDGGPEVIVHDDGAQVTAGAGCRQLDQATVACPRASVTLPNGDVTIHTGDGDDEVLVEAGAPPTAVALGPGDDRSVGAARAGGGRGLGRASGR